jgi:hypothetical protein
VKTAIIAAALLALTVPAHASKFRESDRRNMPLIMKLASVGWACARGNYDDEEGHEKLCKEESRLIDKLYHRGYCYIAYGAVGRPGRLYRSSYRTTDGRVIVNPVRRHCYTIDFPQPKSASKAWPSEPAEPVMKHFKTSQ